MSPSHFSTKPFQGSLSCFEKESWLWLVVAEPSRAAKPQEIPTASSLLPFSGTRLRRQNFNLAPTQYRQLHRLLLSRHPRGVRRPVYYQLMARLFENVMTTPEKIVLYNVRERTLGTRLAIQLVYRATDDKLTKTENNIIIFKLPPGWWFL